MTPISSNTSSDDELDAILPTIKELREETMYGDVGDFNSDDAVYLNAFRNLVKAKFAAHIKQERLKAQIQIVGKLHDSCRFPMDSSDIRNLAMEYIKDLDAQLIAALNPTAKKETK